MWAIAAGFSFSVLNTLLRQITLEMHPFEAQFLRYLFGVVVMLPLILRRGWRDYLPNSISGQFWRGIVHSIGLSLWFFALPHLTLADTTAIGYTGPIFTMIGAAYLLGEKMRPERWAAALIGFVGVLIVVGPRLSGSGNWYSVIMLASAPMFSLSFLLTKMLTRHDRPEVIVAWQGITVSILTMPFALMVWVWPTPTQWLMFAITGVIGSAGHYCLTRSFVSTDISVTQSAKFLDLIWATLWGLLVFGDYPSSTTLIGGLVIIAATIWIGRREAQRAAQLKQSDTTG
jgi:drug/metabolite transporter (DMT)-like permease